MNIRKIFLFLIINLFIVNIAYASIDIPTEIRIGLYYGSKGASSITLSAPAGIEIGTFDGEDFDVIEELDANDKITVKRGNKKGSVTVSGIGEFGDSNNVPYFRSLENRNDERIIVVNDKKYRGDIEIKRYSDSDMTVINVVGMQEYLYGVVPREIGGNSPYEAVKAQAIVARTYAIKNYEKRMKWGFNLYPTVDDQAYGGYEWENVNSNRAVDETDGQVVTYEGKLIDGYYFSTSGGYTENSENVWTSALGYLKAVPDPYEPDNLSKTTWTVELTADEVEERLAKNGVYVGNIINIEPTEYTEAGRVLELKIEGTEGTKIITKSKARTYLGLDSQWYTINDEPPKALEVIVDRENRDDKEDVKKDEEDKKDEKNENEKVEEERELKPLLKQLTSLIRGEKSDVNVIKQEYTARKSYTDIFVIQGRGWGHAVGMSQNGAKGMAENGFTAEEIIKWYYTGVEVTD
ncbi:MAG: SpoIID/LytB domain-containing protein [Clostridia bacterium]|nr:SpoIID/LytB domain-containing protein [Clostridia bacterium]